MEKIEPHGVYAIDNRWWVNVKKIFEEIVDNKGVAPGYKYSEYVKSVKTPVKQGYVLPEFIFIETEDGQVQDSNGHWIKNKAQ